MQDNNRQKVAEIVTEERGGQVSQLYSIQAVELVKEDIDKEEHTKAAKSAVLQLLTRVQFSDALHLFLMEFKDPFAEPNSLPPTRPFDHSIHLKPNSKLVNIKSDTPPPYKRQKLRS